MLLYYTIGTSVCPRIILLPNIFSSDSTCFIHHRAKKCHRESEINPVVPGRTELRRFRISSQARDNGNAIDIPSICTEKCTKREEKKKKEKKKEK